MERIKNSFLYGLFMYVVIGIILGTVNSVFHIASDNSLLYFTSFIALSTFVISLMVSK